jgi:hypothetical protein
VDDLVDPSGRHADVLGDAVLREPQRDHELLKEDFAGMDGGELLLCHESPFVIVDDLDIEGAPVSPLETDAPLLIDAYAPLTDAVPPKFLEPIPGRSSQLLDGVRSVEHPKFSQGRQLDFGRQPAGAQTPEETLGLAAPKTLYHDATLT